MTPWTRSSTAPWRSLIAASAIALGAWTGAAQASGGGDIEDVFHLSGRPDMPMTLFAQQPGSLRPHVGVPYLVVWYWHLEGHRLSAQRVKEVSSALDALRDKPIEQLADAQGAWHSAAAQVRQAIQPAPATAASAVDRAQPRWDDERLSAGLGCYPDAYRQATDTLAQRRAAHPGETRLLLHWLDTQEAVFNQCELQNPSPLPALPAKSPLWLRQDYAYQTAAAHFYAGDYVEASQRFAAIAQDPASPWRPLARYMALRILARQHPSPVVRDPSEQLSEAARSALYTEARKLSAELLADPSIAPWHASVVRLRESLLMRYRKGSDRLRLLAPDLLKPEDPLAAPRLRVLAQAYVECTWGDCQPYLPPQTPGADLIHWINVMNGQAEHDMQGRARPLHETAWQRYQQHPRPAWLFASAVHMPPGDERQKVLQAALAKIPPQHPAHHAALMLRAQWLFAQGRSAEARPLVLPLLDGAVAQASPTERNTIKALLLPSAQSLAEWQRFASRQLVGWRDPEAQDSLDAPTQGLDLLDADGRRSLAQQLPLSAWQRASQHWDPAFRREILQSAWTRAVLTQRFASARAVAAQLVALPPGPPLAPVAPAPGASAPVLPAPPQHIARSSQLSDSDRLGWQRLLLARLVDANDTIASPLPGGPGINNGAGYGKWCLAHEPNGPASEYNPAQPLLPAAPFLSSAERAEWQAEQDGLRALPPDSVYFTQQALALMAEAPQDPLVPEALSVAVRMARHTCKSALTKEWSRKGWMALHKNYPQSPAAARTKYWY